MCFVEMLPISLTSISSRLNILARTLRLLLDQTVKPSGIYVYLSKEPYLMDEGCKQLPQELQLLFATEPLLHLKWVENTGPYRKLVPFAKEFPNTPVLVVDDDVKYVPTFVERAWTLWNEHQCCISFRATKLDLSTSYTTWPDAAGSKDIQFFTKGNGGVVYHTSWFQDSIFYDKSIYQTVAPGADDVWFNAWRIRKGILCICDNQPSFTKGIPTKVNLFQINESKNDEYIQKTWKFVFESLGAEV